MNWLFQLHNDAADRSGGRRSCNSDRRWNRPRTLQRPRYQTGLSDETECCEHSRLAVTRDFESVRISTACVIF